jgi:uncharacterized protein YecA (UPF0149 family)
MRRRSAVALLVAVFVLAACGSSESDENDRRAYINKADAICAHTNADLKETNTRLDELARSARNVSEFQDDLGDGQQLARDELADIKALKVPKGAEDEIKLVIAARERQLDAIDKLIDASKRNDASAFQLASRDVQEARKTAQGEADKFGFRICGQDSSRAGG